MPRSTSADDRQIACAAEQQNARSGTLRQQIADLRKTLRQPAIGRGGRARIQGDQGLLRAASRALRTERPPSPRPARRERLPAAGRRHRRPSRPTTLRKLSIISCCIGSKGTLSVRRLAKRLFADHADPAHHARRGADRGSCRRCCRAPGRCRSAGGVSSRMNCALPRQALMMRAQNDLIDIRVVFQHTGGAFAHLHDDMGVRIETAQAAQSGRGTDEVADMFTGQHQNGSGERHRAYFLSARMTTRRIQLRSDSPLRRTNRRASLDAECREMFRLALTLRTRRAIIRRQDDPVVSRYGGVVQRQRQQT